MSNLNRSASQNNLTNIIMQKIFPDERSKEKVERPSDTRSRSYFLACFFILLTASASTVHLSFERRLQSFEKSDDETTEICWAQSGFHRDSSGVASCCHCGLQANQLKTASPDDLHSSQRPDCTFHRTLQFLRGPGYVTDSETAALAARLEKKIFKLLEMINAHLTGYVQSFGFSRDEVTLGLINFIFTQAKGNFELRPGDLIEILHSLPSGITTFLREVLPEDGALTQLIQSEFLAHLVGESAAVTRTSRVEARMTDSAINNMQYISRMDHSNDGGATITQQDLTSTEPPLKDDESSQCLVCRRRPRDQVLLPCTHLKFCKACASGMTQCRVCGAGILSQLHVYLV